MGLYAKRGRLIRARRPVSKHDRALPRRRYRLEDPTDILRCPIDNVSCDEKGVQQPLRLRGRQTGRAVSLSPEDRFLIVKMICRRFTLEITLNGG